MMRNRPSQPKLSFIFYNIMLSINKWQLPHLGERGDQEVVDDVTGEEESVYKSSIFVAECLRGDSRLGGVCSWEGEVYRPHPGSIGNLGRDEPLNYLSRSPSTLVSREVAGSSSTQSVRDVVMFSSGELSQRVTSDTPIMEVK